MKKQWGVLLGVGVLLASGPAVANKVENLYLGVKQSSVLPGVLVYSTSGEKWDKVDLTRKSPLSLSFLGECAIAGTANKRYNSKFAVENFQVVNYSPSSTFIPVSSSLEATLRWQPGGKVDPVAMCNNELDKRLAMQPGKSRYELLADGLMVTYPGAVKASYQLICEKVVSAGKTGKKTQSVMLDLDIACQKSEKAKAKIPKPKPEIKQAKLVPAVKALKLKLNPVNYQGTCPAKVKVDAGITLNYPAEIKYQYIGDKGHKSPVFTLKKKGKAGSWNLAPWSRTIEVPNTQGKLSIGPAKGDYLHNGWMKIKVLSPKAMTSQTASFKVRCPRTPPKGPGKLQLPSPGQKPGLPALRSGTGGKQPAPTHKPREIVVVGSKAKKGETDKAARPVLNIQDAD